MLFYFSGTGNSLDAARSIAKETGDTLVDMGIAYKKGNFEFFLEQGEPLGFVFPVYRWSTPPLVDDFIRKMQLSTKEGDKFEPGYCYCVLSYGYFLGKEAAFFRDMLMKHKGIDLDASYAIPSVGSCVYLHNPATGKTLEKKLQKARARTRDVAAMISHKDVGNSAKSNPFGSLLSKKTCVESKPRPTDNFHVIESLCTNCGTCVTICPTNTIKLEGGKPQWKGDSCTECLACLHRCPAHASQFGSKTSSRGRYQNPSLSN